MTDQAFGNKLLQAFFTAIYDHHLYARHLRRVRRSPSPRHKLG